MRNLFIALAASAVLLVSGVAQAASDLNLSLTDNFASTTATIDLATQQVFGNVGDVFEVTLTISNPDGDEIGNIFSFITQTNSVGVAKAGAIANDVLLTPGAGAFDPDIVLAPVGNAFGDQAVGQVQGTLVGAAHAGDPTGLKVTGTGPDAMVVLLFTISDTAPNVLGQALLASDSSGPIGLSGEVLVNVPEPGTVLLMGLGLAGLAVAGRRD